MVDLSVELDLGGFEWISVHVDLNHKLATCEGTVAIDRQLPLRDVALVEVPDSQPLVALVLHVSKFLHTQVLSETKPLLC